jgi:hypothetical protein
MAGTTKAAGKAAAKTNAAQKRAVKTAPKEAAVKKTVAKKATAKKATARTATAKKATAKKETAKKETAKKTTAKTATAKKTSTPRAPAGAASASRRIDALIANTRDWRGERLAQVRALIHAVDPQVVEEWKWMGTPVWSHAGMYALANPHKGKVKVMFFHGARLADPQRLFNASLEGGKWRAIDIHEGDALDMDALAALLRAAIAYNQTHAVPKSRGSRA